MIKINIYLAKDYGFCFGVERAVKITEKELNTEQDVYIQGMLIHNEDETNRLKNMGLKDFQDEHNLENSKLILRAHGTPKEIKEKLSKEYELVDTVCTKVIAVQKLAERYKDDYLILFGKKDHPEIISINSYSNYNAKIVEKEDELIELIPELKSTEKNIYIISQTTFNKDNFNKLLNILDIHEINYKSHDTICSATKNRLASVKELASHVDCIIVLGDTKSSNCTKLYEYAKIYSEKVFFINRITEMDISEILVYNNIGITAGASTPDWIIKEAIDKMEDMNKSEMMEAIDSSFKRIKRGDILTGTVLYVKDSEVTVNINYRTDGIINRDEVSEDPNINPSDLFKAGDEIDVYVLKMDDGDGNVLLSHKRVQRLKNWDVIEEKFNNEEIVDAYVNEVTKGGLKCEVEGINAFMPASHVSVGYKKDLSVYLDEVLASKIIDFNKEKRRIILSRKVVEQNEIDSVKEEVYSKLQVGDTIEGEVQRLTNFGAFVDIGGIDGLIHISQLSWQRVKHPSDVVAPGEKIEVKILEIDPEKDRIALGLKQLTQEPWEAFVEKNKVGDVVTGTVVNLLDFGAFVKLDSGVDGLLHVSQIAREHIEKPSDKLEVGQEVEVIITDIDQENRKISLSIKELEKRRVKEARALEQKEKIEAGEIDEVEEKPETESKAKKEEKPAAPKKQKETSEEAQEEQPSFGTTIADLINIENFSTEEE